MIVISGCDFWAYILTDCLWSQDELPEAESPVADRRSPVRVGFTSPLVTSSTSFGKSDQIMLGCLCLRVKGFNHSVDILVFWVFSSHVACCGYRGARGRPFPRLCAATEATSKAVRLSLHIGWFAYIGSQSLS